ncbi:MAG TPA: ScpA family protein [Candidatus Paceibacterota bacterium]
MPDFTIDLKEQDFVGPIELLYELIEKRKLLIHDISLAKVADDFISYIEKQENFPMGEAAQFLTVASTLLLIKSRSLLPGLILTGEEEEDAKSLERRLALYARMRELSKHIKGRWGNAPLYVPLERKDFEIIFAPSEGVTIANLREAFEKVINLIPKIEKMDSVSVAKVVSLEQMIISLGERLEKAMKISFASLVKEHGGQTHGHKHKMPPEAKKNLIVMFLALLELVKRGVVEAIQKSPKAEILIESKTAATPAYGNQQ